MYKDYLLINRVDSLFKGDKIVSEHYKSYKIKEKIIIESYGKVIATLEPREICIDGVQYSYNINSSQNNSDENKILITKIELNNKYFVGVSYFFNNIYRNLITNKNYKFKNYISIDSRKNMLLFNNQHLGIVSFCKYEINKFKIKWYDITMYPDLAFCLASVILLG